MTTTTRDHLILASVTTRETAAMIGALVAAGLRPTVDVDPRVIFVWFLTAGARPQHQAVFAVSRRTGKVFRARRCTPQGSSNPITTRRAIRNLVDHLVDYCY